MISLPGLIEEAARTDWHSAVLKLYGSGEAYLWATEDYRAAAPLLALPVSRDRVLDTSCGRGTYTFALSGVCRAVYATDTERDAVRFLSLRARQSGAGNVIPFVGRAAEVFRPGSFDLILLRGRPTGEGLASFARLLRANGQLCLAVSNSLSLLSGLRDPMALRYGRLRSQLSKSGFCRHRIYAALPDCDDVRLLLATDDARGLPGFLRSRFPSIRLDLPLWLNSTILWILTRFVARGYWVIAKNVH